MSERIELYEVGPRDGFQNIKEYIPLETKLEIIDGMIAAGLQHIQITSFVSPKAIPQMRDARELAARCLERHPEVDFFALIPNLRGAQTARELGMKNLSYVVSLGESHNRANINRSHAESFEGLQRILESGDDLEICLDLATAFGCPFEGKNSSDEVVQFLQQYLELGIETVNLCDTIGIANPAQVRSTISAVQQAYPSLKLQIHIHDTRNMGMVNTLAAVEMGVLDVQATLGGLGGCPYAPGASGNLATEDLAFMLKEMGYDLSVDIPALIALSRHQHQVLPPATYSGHLWAVT